VPEKPGQQLLNQNRFDAESPSESFLLRLLLMGVGQVDHFVRFRLLYFLFGLFVVVQFFLVTERYSFGICTGLLLMGFGIFAHALRNWRSERGLWMLALVVFVPYSVIWLGWQWSRFDASILGDDQQLPKELSSFQLRMAVDSFVGIIVFGKITQFCFTVAYRNWSFSRKFDENSPVES